MSFLAAAFFHEAHAGEQFPIFPRNEPPSEAIRRGQEGRNVARRLPKVARTY
jgi:hypothetical protein